MLPTPYQAMLVAQAQRQDLLHKAEQERLVRAARAHGRTRERRMSLASLLSSMTNITGQKRCRLRLNG